MDLQQVNVGPSAALIVEQGTPVMVFNTDPAVTVWIGFDPFATVAGDPGSAAPLPPLATLVMDGTQSVYGITAAGQSAVCSLFPGGLNFFQLVELLVKTLLISASAGNGMFIYSGIPGLGDLIYSAVAIGGTDPFGNPVLTGETSYNNGGVINTNGGVMQIYPT